VLADDRYVDRSLPGRRPVAEQGLDATKAGVIPDYRFDGDGDIRVRV